MVKIISGGQTGIDRVGLNIGIEFGLSIGGWAPRSFLAEDGIVPSFYGLKEYPIAGYPPRTEQNVLDSDGTLVFGVAGLDSPGTRLTARLCIRHKKYFVKINLLNDINQNVGLIVKWHIKNNIKILNVAGPRKSKLDGFMKSYSNGVRFSLSHRAAYTFRKAVATILSNQD